MTVIAVCRDDFLISTDRTLLDVDAIASFLAGAYWAQGRTRDTIERSLENSIVFGLYHAGRQIGLARVITDKATFAYLADVYIDEAYRGRGLGKWLIGSLLGHPDLQGRVRWLLATRDAHAFYRPFGWQPVAAERWMERPAPAPGTTQ
jgi:GNAT superfamily N-acetyltransferase